MNAINVISGFFLLFILHAAICFLITKEISKKVGLSKARKVCWYILVWFVPILGGVIANFYFKIAKISSGTSANGGGGGF